MILNDRAVKAGTRPVTRHQVEWAASGLRRATTEAGVALPIDYSQAVAAAAGLTRAAELGVTRLGVGVVIHTRPSIDRELPVVAGYADGRGRWSRDGHRHTTTTAPDFSQRGSDAVNGPHGNRPTPPRLTVIARPDTVIEAHGHQAGSPYKGTLDVTAVAIAAIRSGQVDRYCPVTQSGRELSKFQLLRILAVHPSAPVLAFDGDLAGRDSAGRYGQALPLMVERWSLRRCPLRTTPPHGSRNTDTPACKRGVVNLERGAA